MSSPEERLARLEANHDNLRDDLHEIKADLKMVLEAVNKGKGAWKVAAAAGAVVAGFVSLVAKKMGLA